MSRISITSKLARTADPELLTFDSEFWGQRIGRAYTPDINKWAADNLIGTVCLLVNSEDPRDIQTAETQGFRFMDVRVTLDAPSTAYGPKPDRVRSYYPSDLDDLVRIARESHRITRFYSDPYFDDERCDDLYEAWIKNSVAGWAQKTIVASSASGRACGYCTIHIQGDSGSVGRVGSIGLIAVDESERGLGLGQDLVRSAMAWCYDHHVPNMTVVTQGRNIAAQRVFQRCGFVTKSTEIWLHKHYEDQP